MTWTDGEAAMVCSFARMTFGWLAEGEVVHFTSYSDNVITAIVGFIFVCIVMPQLVKNRPQYYIAVAAVLISLALKSLATMLHSDGFWNFVQAFSILLEACCILLLILATGGLSPSQLAGEFGKAYEVMRRGETEKTTVIVPLTGEQPKRREPPSGRGRTEVDEAAPPKTGGGSIPLD
jgi:hypothetical protein